MNQVKNIFKENYLLILLFIIFIFVLFFIFQNSKEDKIRTHLTNTKKIYNTQYKRVYESFHTLSQNTFYGILNKPAIYNNIKDAYNQDEKTQQYYRDKLYNIFISDYTRLVGFNFKQLHFHFPDNTSFLRMHKPDKFGDDLTNIRNSVKKVNEFSKPFNGFEMGRIIHGFRFVYPLNDENLNHIGSVEVSLSSKIFEEYYENHYDTDVHFLTKKTISDMKMFKEEIPKQIISDENDDYYINNNTNDGKNELLHHSNEEYFHGDTLKTIKDNMFQGKEFILSKKIHSTFVTITFLPIQNINGIKNSAYLVLYTKSTYLQQLHDSFNNLLLIILLLIIVFMLVLYQKYKINIKDKKRDLMLSQQSKMASMGEMIGNIAHQWRQPLSVISTAATGMKAQKEFGVLTDEIFNTNVDQIYKSTQYLSQTIEDFRNFFSTNKEKVSFNIHDLIDESFEIFGSSFKIKNISIVKNINNITLVSYKNELKQVFINLFKNSMDVMQDGGVIIVTVRKKNKKIIITIQDSGGGINKKIIARIFEPYFTTKHQSVGTGLGLFMSHEIINKSLNSTLEVSNKKFTYQFKDYIGACFQITLDIENSKKKDSNE